VKVWRNSLEAINERRARRTGSIDANVPKLNLEKARRIRRALRSGVDAEVLAEAYGVRLTTIRKVQRNESYPEAQP
jgi:DNA invertase Pin-like site-specific DNA recombinase